MFKVNNKDPRTAPLVSLLLISKYFRPYSSDSIVNFDHAWNISSFFNL